MFGKSRSTINEHILNIDKEGELSEADTMRKIGISDFSTKPTNFYNLDVVISVGYRVHSVQGTRFRQWATQRIHEYIIKGYTLDDERTGSRIVDQFADKVLADGIISQRIYGDIGMAAKVALYLCP